MSHPKIRPEAPRCTEWLPATSQTATPVYLQGEVVIGAVVPVEVQLYPTPDYAYPSAYINGRWVLVDPQTRAIVYIFI